MTDTYIDGRVKIEEGVKVAQRWKLRQVGMYETVVILSCDNGKLSYATWQVPLSDKKW